ncbi:MAG: Mobile element protein [Nitrospira sp.]|nr:Mobile element protein [Nitrospira sp.]
MPRPSVPKSRRQFQPQFASEDACAEYLTACRWPDGFRCPRCGQPSAYGLAGRHRWQCASCRYQVSVTAGTVLHNSKTPLTTWFWAAYLMTTDKRGACKINCVTGYHASSREEGGFDDQARHENGCVVG